MLPGRLRPLDAKHDPRWRVIFDVGYFVDTDPDPVWEFIQRWGVHRSEDLRAAIGCCLLEHLLQFHFRRYFPRVRQLARENARFAFVAGMCSEFGQARIPANTRRLRRLKSDIKRWHPRR